MTSSSGASAARAIPVFGDLTTKKLGVGADDIKKLKGQVDHFYHLAAVYDLGADTEAVCLVQHQHAVAGLHAIDHQRRGFHAARGAGRPLDSALGGMQ